MISSRSICVALCTYNGAAYVREQLDSIANQSRLPDHLLVVDDCSADKTLTILEEFVRNAPFPADIVRNEVNLGYTKNFEKAVTLCGGEVIVLCDQDDVWRFDKLARIEAYFATHANIDLVFSDAELVDKDLQQLSYTLWEAINFNAMERRRVQKGDAFKVLLRRNVVSGATMAFRARIKPHALPIPHEWTHDEWIAFVIAARTGQLGFIPDKLIRYRQHGANQLGARRVAWTSKVSRVLAEQAESLDSAHCKMLELRERLGESSPAPAVPMAIQELDNKLQHLEFRRQLLQPRVLRAGPVLRELLRGRYQRYSNGWRSAARDILEPGRSAQKTGKPGRRQTVIPLSENNRMETIASNARQRDFASCCGEVAAVVVAYNPSLQVLKEELLALAAQVGKILVVDNASHEALDAWLSTLPLPVEYIRLGRNYGIAKAQNIGIATARESAASYVLLMDHDSVPAPGMVNELLAVHQELVLSGAPVAAIGPRYRSSTSDALSPFMRFGKLRFTRAECGPDKRWVECHSLISSGALINLETLDQVGGMDEELFIDRVDNEWFLRAHAQGYRAFGACDAIMQHGLGCGIHRVWLFGWRDEPHHAPFRYYYIFRNSILLYKRSYVRFNWVLRDVLRLTKMVLLFGVMTRPRVARLRMMWRGLIHGVRGITGPLPD